MKEKKENFFQMKAQDLMTKHPKTIFKEEKLTEASRRMTQNKINSLLVLDQSEKCIGIVQVFDLKY